MLHLLPLRGATLGVACCLDVREQALGLLDLGGGARRETRNAVLERHARLRLEEVDAALSLHEERLQVFDALGDQRSRAVTLGDIARIKVSRGEDRTSGV